MTALVDDDVMARISEALDQFNAGRRADARLAFAAVWADIEADGSPFHQCILAHYMAGAQDDPLDELKWDRIALAAADSMAKAGAATPEPSLSVLSFYPSLHLNLADALHRTGDDAAARRHLDLARATVDALADDGYGQMVRNGVDRLAQRLAAS